MSAQFKLLGNSVISKVTDTQVGTIVCEDSDHHPYTAVVNGTTWWARDKREAARGALNKAFPHSAPWSHE